MSIVALLIICISSTFHCAATSTQSAKPETPQLTPSEKKAIQLLSDGQVTLPAWVVAQFLNASDRVHQRYSDVSTTGTPLRAPQVAMNQLLAEPNRYRGTLCAIRSRLISVTDISKTIDLPPQDTCFSILALDSTYAVPLQLFTTSTPAGFRKDQNVYVIGYFLAIRIDQPEDPAAASQVSVPMFVGAAVPAIPSPAQRRRLPTKSVFTLVAALTATYIIIRIYIARSTGAKGKAYRFDRKEPTSRWKR